ncbi:hypothetical protein PINS_up006051 [Pythium insidiosum]|nr:hypothetical protein PINS_up006051 [Pythium insidiosum]
MDDDSDHRTSIQHVLFTVIVLLSLIPLCTLIWKSTDMRRWLWASGCVSWVRCCDRCLGGSTLYDDHDLQALRELEEANAMEQRRASERRSRASHGPQRTLRLASWREDVRRQSIGDGCPMKRLKQLQISSTSTCDEGADADADIDTAYHEHCPGTPSKHPHHARPEDEEEVKRDDEEVTCIV